MCIRDRFDKQQKEEAPQQDDALDSNNPLEDLSTGKSENNNPTQSSTPTETGEEEGQEESPFDNLEPVDQHKGGEEPQPLNEEKEEWHGNPSVSSAGRQNGPTDKEPQVTTAQAAESAQKKLVNRSAGENTYVEVPSEIPIDYHVDNKTIADLMEQHYSAKEKIDLQESYPDSYALDEARRIAADLVKCDADFKAFKVSSNKEVNYLV